MRKILITSGPTRAKIDAVRYIANESTGTLGTKIAKEFLKKKDKVTFIYGKGSIHPIKSLDLIEIETIEDLTSEIKKQLKKEKYDIIIHLMAVLDYVPKKCILKKIPSDKDELNIKLIKTPKIIKLIRKLMPNTFLVGFKLEIESSKQKLYKIAYQFLLENKLDLIVANTYLKKEKYIGYIINPQGKIENISYDKDNLAKKLIKIITYKLNEKNG